MNCKEYLTKDILPFWLKNGIDEEYGGILTQLERDGTVYGTEKSVWFQGRALMAAKKIIDITMPKGVDPVHGGIISFRDALGKPSTALEWDMKLWWPQNEAIIANRMAYEIFGEGKYKTDYETILEYTQKHFRDPECGEWYGYLHYDNTVSTDLKGNIFKGPFHLPRMLMVLDAIEKGDFLSFFGKV